MTPFKLTLKSVVEANIKAYQEKRLGAQLGTALCLYRYPSRPDCGCAIGVALPSEVLDRIDLKNINSVSIGTIRATTDDVIKINPAEFSALHSLQAAHDQWTSGPRDHQNYLHQQYLSALLAAGAQAGITVDLPSL